MQNLSLLRLYTDLHYHIKSDSETLSERSKIKDREIGIECEKQRFSDYESLSYWLDHQSSNAIDTPGLRLFHALRMLSLGSLILGLLTGWGVTQALLAYDGSEPVNIIHTFVVLILSQLFLLGVGLLMFIPVFRTSLSSWLLMINPGYWSLRMMQALDRNHVSSDHKKSHTHKRFSSLIVHHSTLGLPVAFRLTQLFAVAFNLSAISCLSYLAVSSDLAFGWSTTINFDPNGLHQWIKVISAPWAGGFPDASPSLRLVEVSQYFRLENLNPPNVAIAQESHALYIGQWWQFLLASIIFYGFLPRLITLIWSNWKLKHCLVREIQSDPSIRELLIRLKQPLIETKGQSKDDLKSVSVRIPKFDLLKFDIESFACIRWSEAKLDTTAPPSLTRLFSHALEAGGTLSPKDDAEVIDHIHAQQATGAFVAAKGWDTPMLDFIDFLAELRDTLPNAAPIVVLLARLDGLPLSNESLSSWHAALSERCDEYLFLQLST